MMNLKIQAISLGLLINLSSLLSAPLHSDEFRCTEDGTFAAFNCKKYYQCIYTNTPMAYKVLRTCQSGLLFDDALKTCNWAHLVECSDEATAQSTPIIVTVTPNTQSAVTSPSSSDFQCAQDGLYAVFQCTKYYQCVYTNTPNAFKILNACPSGLLFDNTLKYCNWANLVKCESSNNVITTPNAKTKTSQPVDTSTSTSFFSVTTSSKSTSSASSAYSINPTYQEFSQALAVNGYPAPSTQQYNNFINGASSQGNITTKRELAMFLSQIMHESGGLIYTLEIACGTGCANCPGSYSTPQDYPGKYYCGRGYIQLVKPYLILYYMRIYCFIAWIFILQNDRFCSGVDIFFSPDI